MVLMCWMVSSFRYLRAKALKGLLTRATGTLPVIVQPPECCWTLLSPGMNFFKGSCPHAGHPGSHLVRLVLVEKLKTAFRNQAQKRARHARVNLTTQRRMLCFSSSAL